MESGMTPEERRIEQEKLKKGLELAEYRFLKDKAMRNLSIIVGDGDTGYKEVSARELFVKLYNEPVPEF